MTEPSEGLPKTKAGATEITARAERSFDQLDSLNANRLDQLPGSIQDLPEQIPYKKERLFSRKVMVAWAAATLVLYFWVTFIVPAVIETVKGEIESRMEAPTSNTAIPAPADPAAAPVVAPPLKPLPPLEPLAPLKTPAAKK